MKTKTFKKFLQPFFLTLLLSYSLTVLNIQAQTWPPNGMLGTGEESNPWQITSPAHLEALALYVNAGNGNETNGVYYKMMNNIDLIGYAQGEGWEPIGKWLNASSFSNCFQGNFDGNGNIIQNLTINRPSESYIGLFGYTANGNIQNIGIDNCNIEGKNSVGGLVGQNSGNIGNGSNIKNCYATGKVKGIGGPVGGLMGSHRGHPLKNCFTLGDVSGYGYVGGLLGGNSDVAIINCYSLNSVKGTYSLIGGLVGTNSGEIINCVAANDSIILYASATSIGRISGSTDSFRNNYALNSMVVQNSQGNVPITDGLNTKDGKGVGIELLQNADFYSTASYWYGEAWDISTSFDDPTIWRICDGEGLPFFHWQKIGCGSFTITATAGEHGTIFPPGEIEVDEFEDQTFFFYPNTGYIVDSVFIDGVYITNAGSYTFENVNIDHTIHVTFREGVGVASASLNQLKVYPNPTQNKFMVDFEGEATIVIYDFFGKELSSQKFNCKTETNISHLPVGVYTIQVFSEGKVIGSSKIVKK